MSVPPLKGPLHVDKGERGREFKLLETFAASPPPHPSPSSSRPRTPRCFDSTALAYRRSPWSSLVAAAMPLNATTLDPRALPLANRDAEHFIPCLHPPHLSLTPHASSLLPLLPISLDPLWRWECALHDSNHERSTKGTLRRRRRLRRSGRHTFRIVLSSGTARKKRLSSCRTA